MAQYPWGIDRKRFEEMKHFLVANYDLVPDTYRIRPDYPVYVGDYSTINVNQEKYEMSSTAQAQNIDKGLLRHEVSIIPASNGSFIVNAGYGRHAFSNVEDMLAFLKTEGKKFETGHAEEVEAKKVADKARKTVN